MHQSLFLIHQGPRPRIKRICFRRHQEEMALRLLRTVEDPNEMTIRTQSTTNSTGLLQEDQDRQTHSPDWRLPISVLASID